LTGREGDVILLQNKVYPGSIEENNRPRARKQATGKVAPAAGGGDRRTGITVRKSEESDASIKAEEHRSAFRNGV